MISSENKYISTKLRMQGYLDALANYHIEHDQADVEYASNDYSFTSARKLANKILSKKNRVTALFCISDIMALGAVYGAREVGLDVPKDVTVLGFDNLEYTEMMVPRISTVEQPCNKIGAMAMERVQEKLMSPNDEESKIVILPHRIVIRDSTKKFK